MMDRGLWAGRRVLVTGHTGFKGSWLCTWLDLLGARVTGLALAPADDGALFHSARVGSRVDSRIGDVRDARIVRETLTSTRPEIVFHLAAQPLLLRSLEDPVETVSTNVIGTMNLLEAVRLTPSVRVLVAVTSDKCYRDPARICAEDDALGGHDPYSASKASAEILVRAWRDSFLPASGGIGVATARAGNVVGGGDLSANRLVPDLVHAFFAGRSIELRQPASVRPWQHVLDALAGYLMLAKHLWNEPAAYSTAFNFGPDPAACRTVAEVADEMARILGRGSWYPAARLSPHEAPTLRLDSTRAHQRLGWRPLLDLAATLRWTVEGYARFLEGGDVAWLEDQIRRYATLQGIVATPSTHLESEGVHALAAAE
ncbi:MAG: CDP-glucose 4,6-dehydratase [Geminicoccaceae bacterium]